MKSLLVTGGSGLLGNAVVRQAVGKFKVRSTYHNNPVSLEGAEFIRVDLLDKMDVATLALANPDIIIHCSALTNVDYCESHPDEAYAQNVQVSVNVARMALNLGAYLIHISTDGVFNGKKGLSSEDDPPDPINTYAKSKLEAEQRVSETYSHSCIVRTNIFGWNPTARKSMAEWMISILSKGEVLTAFEDVVISPLLTEDLAGILFGLCRLEYEGLVHIGSRDSCSKLQFANVLSEVFMLDKGRINPTRIDEMHLEARRPKNTSLNVQRISSLLGRQMPSVLDGILKMKQIRDSCCTRRADDGNS